MDPMAASIKKFQEDFHEFADNPNIFLLHILMDPKDTGTMVKVLRAEEWHPSNKSPFLIFDTAYTTKADTCESMTSFIRQHYKLLQTALTEDGHELPHIAFPNVDSMDPLTCLIIHVNQFKEAIKHILAPPMFCWLPAKVENKSEWIGVVRHLISLYEKTGVRMIIAAGNDFCEQLQDLPPLRDRIMTISFAVDESAMMEYFGKLMGPPSLGRAKGTLPGSAAPDVEPPKRPGPPEPTEAEIKAAVAKAGLPPVLTHPQAEKLRQLVLEAAAFSGERNMTATLTKQREACELCQAAGVTLEQALMTLLLANYYLQFGKDAEAEAEFRHAEKLACDALAFAQISQIRMAMACLFLKQQRLEEAAATYEQAAAVAGVGDAKLLYVESLRMAGICHMQLNRKTDAMLCWQAAVRKMKDASPDEIRFSNFLDAATLLINLLRDNGMDHDALRVEAMVTAMGQRTTA